MKAVLLSIQPRHVENICTVVGEKDGKPIYKKRVELRKVAPKSEAPFKCYIYCTQGKLLYENFPNGTESREIKLATYQYVGQSHALNGKVIGEFVCDRIDCCPKGKAHGSELAQAACLTPYELTEYSEHYSKNIYAWHISDLKIYDKPKELWEFNKFLPCELSKQKCGLDGWDELNDICGHCAAESMVIYPPQSWFYVKDL